MQRESFTQDMVRGYTFQGSSILLGAAIHEGHPLREVFIRLPLATFTRHGLIAGATGTGKTKTLQILAEQLSGWGVPSLVMDIKGDLSGVAAAGEANARITARHEEIGLPYVPAGSPVELLTLSDQPGVRLRATVAEFGPVLFAKMLELNDTQQSVITVIFKFCDDQDLPLLDLQDVKKVMQYVTGEGKAEFEASYGKISGTTTGIIMRKIVALEQQGAGEIFGEPSFEVSDLLRTDQNGLGIIHVLRLTDVQDRPKLFSTFMLQLLAEIYATFPEAGDLEKPKLVLFIDEAHLMFENATKALLDQVEVIIKLIRSKGVGIFFVTQNPIDVPEAILGQLGMKVQHALRAFTARDRASIEKAARNFPDTAHYRVPELLTGMGIGEALVTALNEKGIPTPLAHVSLRAPQSRMDVLTEPEIARLVSHSGLTGKYSHTEDRESAHEILSAKLEEAKSAAHGETIRTQHKRAAAEKSTLEKVLTNPTTRQLGNTVVRELTRGLLGVLGVRSVSRTIRKKGPGWF